VRLDAVGVIMPPHMATRGFLLALIGCLAILAYGGDAPPQTSASTPQGEERITGNERLGWDQQAPTAGELAGYRYAIYVDGVRSGLTEVSCAFAAGTQASACSARLPAMAPGSHTLELATFVIDGAVLESGRSAPLRVIVGAAAVTSSAANWRTSEVVTTADHLRWRLELMTSSLEDPTDVGVAPDGRVFIAELAGRIRIVQNGRLQRDPALALEDVDTTDERGLLAVAIDPQFQRTGFVYTIYTAPSANGTAVFRLARFREVRGRLAERAILLDEVPAASRRPAVSLRFGPDAKLYAAFDDGGDTRRGGDLASYAGKVLRVNPDGSTPTDRPGGSPVYAYGVRSPRGMDWQPTTGTLWIADAAADNVESLNVVTDTTDRLAPRVLIARYSLPMPLSASSMWFYRSSFVRALRGDLLMTAQEGRYILRLHFDRSDPTQIAASERLLENRVGSVRAIGIGPRGEIYFCTPDALGRLVPV